MNLLKRNLSFDSGKAMTLPLLVLFLIAIHSALAFTDCCKNHTFNRPNSSQIMHFSKENSDRDFGIYDKFKCLHCCCHGYRSIEWFKDGLAYPWPTNVSTLIIRPESGNQTICSHRSMAVDSGKYCCLARNDTHFLKHEVILQISGPSISMGWPKTTYRPRDQQADPGESVRFFCEAFVGTIDLPDFQSDITWERYDQNESFIDGDRVLQESIFREEKRVLGSYLYFKEVSHEDYGEYRCRVRNLGDQVLTLSAWLKRREEVQVGMKRDGGEFWVFFFWLGLLIVVASICTICAFRFASFKLFRSRKSRSSRLANDANKDVLVIYHEYNKKEALKVVSGLQGRRHFGSYSVLPLQSRSQLMEEGLKAKANSYRAVMAVVSPSLVEWSCQGIHELIQGLLKVHFTIGCVFLEALPTPTPDSNEWRLLEDTLSKIHCIEKTSGKKSLNFWSLELKKTFTEKKSIQKGSSQALI